MNNSAFAQYNTKQASLPIVAKEHDQNSHQALWLCIYFPKLAAHSLKTNTAHTAPLVIFEEYSSKRIIHYASPYAQQFGVEAGMDLSKAYILCEQIQAYPRDQTQEKALIKRLADWALQFSPCVSIKYESSILIEIRGSLKLFNGIVRLQKKIIQQLQKKGYLCTTAVSPTPLASFLFSKASRNVVIEDKKILRSELGKLDLQDFLIDRKNLTRLHNIGVRKGYELFRLPPASLARRFGRGFCCYLNELLGITLEPITPIRPRYSFYEFYEFLKDQEKLEIILIHIHILLKTLIRFLIQRDLSTRELKFVIYSSSQKTKVIEVASNTPCRNEHIWKNLITEKFYATLFNSSTYKVALHVDQFDPYLPKNENILRNNQESYSTWQIALGQLAARLGEKSILTLDATEDYRPEYSHIKQIYSNKKYFKKNFLAHPYRPAWLLEKPRPTSIKYLQKSSNVERIEDGWWDRDPIRRDYFIAKNKNNSLLWIFADLKKHGQHFIHGYFA